MQYCAQASPDRVRAHEMQSELMIKTSCLAVAAGRGCGGGVGLLRNRAGLILSCSPGTRFGEQEQSVHPQPRLCRTGGEWELILPSGKLTSFGGGATWVCISASLILVFV